MTDHRTPRRPAAVLAAFAGALALVAASSACAQQPAPSGRAARATAAVPADVDSIVPRAQRSRSKGAENAPVTLVEVSDFQCPYCRQFAETTYKQLDSAYIRTGKVRLTFISFPLPNHAKAFGATEAAMCAGAQGKFWPMHDRLFATQREWGEAADATTRFDGFASALGLNMAAYRDCTANDRVATIIVNDIMDVSRSGINGTPAFVLNGSKLLSGAIPFDQLRTEIDALLAAGPAGPRAPAAPAGPPTP